MVLSEIIHDRVFVNLFHQIVQSAIFAQVMLKFLMFSHFKTQLQFIFSNKFHKTQLLAAKASHVIKDSQIINQIKYFCIFFINI